MRIDNRKVNGQITIEPEDTIPTWMIAINGQTAFWFTGGDETANLIELPAGVAGAHIKTTVTAFDPGITKLSIDIGEIMAGHTLEIALPSGVIIIKDSK